jgi:regulator of RNase E activity RraB
MYIETGRFENLRIEERICCFCSDFIEDVLLNCPFYDDVRENLFNVAKSYTVDLSLIS